MALITKTPFVLGTVFTPDVATEMAGVTFDDQPTFYGHYPRIVDSSLSNAAGQIKDRVAQNDLNLMVSAGSGLNANYAAGKALYGNNVYTIGASSIALVASSANYIYVDIDGVVKTTVNAPPIFRALLSIVTTNTTGVVTVSDQREGYKVETIRPLSVSLRNFGGRGDAGAFVAAGGEVLGDGEYYFTDFIIPSGKNITIAKLARIYCTGKVDISGIVTVSQASSGGGKIAVFGLRGVGGSGQGAGGGQGEDPASPYNHLISPVGSGGGGGYVGADNLSNNTILSTSVGGAGGGGLWIEAAGAINISGLVTAVGTSGNNGATYGASVGTYISVGGAGGGSGGLVLLKSLTSIVVGGTISVTGGNGGAGVVGGGQSSAESGSGGGGGRIVMYCPNINTTGSTLNVSGGAGGGVVPTSPTNAFGLGGVGGSFGGAGGTQSGNGVAGGAGVLITRNFTPIG